MNPNPTMGGDSLLERARKAMGGLEPLTGYGEDAVWRPANKAWEAMRDLIDTLERERAEALNTINGLARLGELVTAFVDPSGVLNARGLTDALTASEALVASLRNQLEGAREALKPFAAAWIARREKVAAATSYRLAGAICSMQAIPTVADFRLAASTLDQLEGKGSGSANASPSAALHGANLDAEPSAPVKP